MKMIKTILFLLLSFAFTAVYADVVELDNQNPDHCRQQILAAKDQLPVIMIYQYHCPYAKAFMPIYEETAKENPDRAFFKFDVEGAPGKPANWQAQVSCLQQTGRTGSPTVIVVYKDTDQNLGDFYTAPIRANGGGNMTKDDLLKLITFSSNEKQQLAMAKK